MRNRKTRGGPLTPLANGWPLSIGLAAWIACAPRALAADPPQNPTSATQESKIEERLRKLEEMNRLILEQNRQILNQADQTKREAETRLKASDDRYRDLENKYNELKTRVEQVPEKADSKITSPPPTGPSLGQPEEREEHGEHPELPLNARLGEGFSLKSEDDEYILRFHVLDQTDFKDFIPNNQSPTRSGLYIPRVRLYFEGRLTDFFEYEVSLQRSVDGAWDLLDGNLNINFDERFQIKFGRMLTPYSFDWYDHLEQYFITPERSLFALNYGLARQAGLLAHGYLADDRIQYAIGGYDGHLVGLADNNTSRDVAAYLNLRPFLKTEDRPALRNFNIGGSIFGGLQVSPQGPLPLRTSIQSAENDEAAQSATSTFLRFNEDAFSLGGRQGGAIHLAYYVGGLSLESEVQRATFGYAKSQETGHFNVPVSGFHVATSYFITGEQVNRRETVVPLHPFDRRKHLWGPGAIEPYFRYSQLNLSQNVFKDGLSDPNDWSANAYMTEIGFNWYLNQYIKWYVDWQHAYFGGKEVLLNPNSGLHGKYNDLFWVRCQVYF